MSVYRFDNTSSINEMIIHTSAGGGLRAFLFAGPNVEPGQIKHIKNSLENQTWRCVPTEYEGRHCLEVRGPRNKELLEKALRAGDFVNGKRVLDGKDDTQFSAMERIQHNMLFVSGVLNVIADCGIIMYGILKHKLEPEKKPWEETAASIAYATGSISLAAFGRGDLSDHQVREIAKKLQQKLQADGIKPPQGALTSFVQDHRRKGLDRPLHFLHRHPADTFNTLTASAGLLYAKSGIKNGRVMDTALGISTMAAGATAVLVKEKAPDKTKPEPKTIFGKAWRWIEERPNRVAGYGYMFSTFAHGAETVKEIVKATKIGDNELADTTGFGQGWKKRHLSYLTYGMRAMFVVPNLLAELLISLSSKGHGEGVKSDSGIDETAYAIVADTIIHAPLDKREHLIKDLSRNFLTNPDVLGGNADEIEKAVRARVEKLAENPWLQSGIIAKAPTPTKIETKPTRTVNWQDRTAAQVAEARSI